MPPIGTRVINYLAKNVMQWSWEHNKRTIWNKKQAELKKLGMGNCGSQVKYSEYEKKVDSVEVLRGNLVFKWVVLQPFFDQAQF